MIGGAPQAPTSSKVAGPSWPDEPVGRRLHVEQGSDVPEGDLITGRSDHHPLGSGARGLISINAETRGEGSWRRENRAQPMPEDWGIA